MASKIKPAAPSAQDALLSQLFGIGGGNTRDFRPLLKDEMRTLDRELASAAAKAGDRVTRAHLADVRDEIKAMLDPTKYHPAARKAVHTGQKRGERQHVSPRFHARYRIDVTVPRTFSYFTAE
jgi:hypothetical protein